MAPAPAVLSECTKEKMAKRKSQDPSFSMMRKPQKLSQEYCFDSLPDNMPESDVLHESEDVERVIGAGSDDCSSPKRKKCINLNIERSDGFIVPRLMISLSKVSGSRRKELERKLRSELEQIQMFKKRLLSISMETSGVTKASFVNAGKNKNELQSGTQMKPGSSGKLETTNLVVSPPPVNISNLALMKQCEALLKRLMSQRYAWVFNSPVDEVKLKIPDYYTVIKHPMDLGTIMTKITSGVYSNPWGFAADVRLTFTNAMTYNPPNNDVHIMANTLSMFFEARWKPIEKKLAAANAHIENEIQAPKSEFKKWKISLTDYMDPISERIMHQMTKEEKLNLTRLLESHLTDLPDYIINFLKKQSGNLNQICGEIEIDIESLGDDTLFELRNLLDKHLKEKEKRQQMEMEQNKVEVAESGVSTSLMDPCKGNDNSDEDVDICGDDGPMFGYPSLDILKNTKLRNPKCSNTSSCASDSGSGNKSREKVSIPKRAAKEHYLHKSVHKSGSDQERSDIMNPIDVNGGQASELNLSEDNDSKPLLIESNRRHDGELAPSERQVSPDKQYRAALLKKRFADTILKAREKTLNQGSKGDPEKIQRQQEKIKQMQREEKARLQAEAEAAEDARKQAEAKAAAEAKRKRELEREAARQALLKIKKTVEINEDSRILKDLELLQSVPNAGLPMYFDNKCSGNGLDVFGGFSAAGCNPLEKLGLFIKVDDEDEEDGESNGALVNNADAEEGEIY